ncbi:MAG: chain length-determining protein, partial [Gammaproteobacteria bacterium]|nr:chain length-determining protein [Gammaproteobacteria bacterium]
MNDVLIQILSYARGMWRYRWYAVGVVWLVCLIGWIAVFRIPDQYSASTRVYVDTRTVLKPLLRGLAIDQGGGIQREVQLMTRTLLSRPNLEKVARMTDLDLNAKTPESMEGLINNLASNITITAAKRGPNLFTISYDHSNPELAKRVVQSLLTIFVETSLGANREDTDSAQKFLVKQIKEYEEKLVEAEDRLKEFKRKNVGMMPGEGKSYFQNLQSAMLVLEEAKLSLKEAENRRDELKRQLEDEEPDLLITDDGEVVASSYSSKIKALEEKLDMKLLEYTGSHPDVLSLKKSIALMKKREDKKLQEGGSTKDEPRESAFDKTNPVYQQLKISLGEAEANVASLKTRADEYERRVEHLKQAVDTIPQIEAELKQLNRSYSVHKENYNKLLSRLESAKMSQQAEETTDTTNFKVIDPPHAPSHPTGPNRILLMSIVLIGGLLAGMGLSLLMYMMKPTFD